MTPFPLVMFVSFETGELIISMNQNVDSIYSKAHVIPSQFDYILHKAKTIHFIANIKNSI